MGEFSDESFSAYSGNRGPGLEQAKELSLPPTAQSWQPSDADRFARGAGDAPGAAEHLGEVYFQMKRQGVELWTRPERPAGPSCVRQSRASVALRGVRAQSSVREVRHGAQRS